MLYGVGLRKSKGYLEIREQPTEEAGVDKEVNNCSVYEDYLKIDLENGVEKRAHT